MDALFFYPNFGRPNLIKMDTNTISNLTQISLENWRENEKKALEILKVVGQLRFDKGVELVLFRNKLYDVRPTEVIEFHNDAIHYTKVKFQLELTLSLAQAINKIDNITASKIDIGSLGVAWLKEKDDFENIIDFIHTKLRDFSSKEHNDIEPRDVVLYGFGRIGRLLTRIILESTGRGNQLRLKAIVLRQKMKNVEQELNKRIALLKSDSVHGRFFGDVKINAEDASVEINGSKIYFIFAGKPSEINYEEFGIRNALVIDNTGVWRDKAGLSEHLRPGATDVILTAPGNDIPNIVYGANHQDLDLQNNHVFSAASCTTNAIVPIIKSLDRAFGVNKGHIETIHAYTSDQNLLDNFHKKPRRGRAAAMNMVLTTTGAAKAVSKVIPHLAGKLTGNAVRVPTPNVSLAIIQLDVQKGTMKDEVNAYLKETSRKGNWVEQVMYSENTELVSNHAVGTTSTCVIDSPSTIVSEDGKTVMIYAWYDNEYGYSCQVVRLAKHIANVRRPVFF